MQLQLLLYYCWLIDWKFTNLPINGFSDEVWVFAQVYRLKITWEASRASFWTPNSRHLFIGINYWKVEIIFLLQNIQLLQTSRNLRCSKRNSDQRKLCLKSSLHNLNPFWTLNSNNFNVEIIANLIAFRDYRQTIAKKHSFPVAETLSMQKKTFEFCMNEFWH